MNNEAVNLAISLFVLIVAAAIITVAVARLVLWVKSWKIWDIFDDFNGLGGMGT